MEASVNPLSKTPSPTTPSDTRPIAILCSASKVIERIVHEQLTAYLTTHDVLDPYQSGFTAHHSTQTALLGVLDHVRRAIERRELTGLLAFDFSKAFDTLPHARLFLKLRRIGCSDRAVQWFGSYLQGRTQAVKSGDGNSDWLPLSTGVPQGSVSGPLLFIIFLLDLPRILSYVFHIFYADDLEILLDCPPTPEGSCTTRGKTQQ